MKKQQVVHGIHTPFIQCRDGSFGGPLVRTTDIEEWGQLGLKTDMVK
ncbi:hypothetical protein [Peribacillus deserti]|nr:hypothetical protein [Peribacillus deserti]